MPMNLLSLAQMLLAGQQDPSGDPANPLRSGTDQGPLPTSPVDVLNQSQRPIPASGPSPIPTPAPSSSGSDFGMRFMVGQMIGQAMRGQGGGMGSALMLREMMAERARQQAVQQNVQLQQARAGAYARGVSEVQDRIKSQDFEGANAAVQALAEGGMLSEKGAGALTAMIDRGRGQALIPTIEQSTELAPMVKASLIAGLKTGSIDPKTAMTMVEHAHTEALPTTITGPGGAQYALNRATGQVTPLVAGQQVVAPGSSLVTQGPEGPQATYTAPTLVKTDEATAKNAILAGLPVKSNVSDYSQAEMGRIRQVEVAQRNQQIQADAQARVSAQDQIEAKHPWRDAYGGRYKTATLFDAQTGDRVTDAVPYGQVAAGLGSKYALVTDKGEAQMATFANRGLTTIDSLADLLPKVLATGKVGPGSNLGQALKVAVQMKLAPNDVLGQFESLQAMSKFDVASVESRSSRLLAVQLKQVGEQQIPALTDNVGSALGKLRVAKFGLSNVQRGIFGQPLLNRPTDIQMPNDNRASNGVVLPPRR